MLGYQRGPGGPHWKGVVFTEVQGSEGADRSGIWTGLQGLGQQGGLWGQSSLTRPGLLYPIQCAEG